MLIEFTFNSHLLILLIFPIFKQIDSIIKNLYLQKDNTLFKIFRMFLSYEFSIIFLIISKYTNKSKKKEKEIKSNEELDKISENFDGNIQIEIEYKKLNRRKQIKSILFLVLLSLINVGSYFYNYYVGNNNIKFSRNTIGIIFEIIIYFLLSLIFLKQRFFKHHYLIFLVMFISLMGLFIYYSAQLKDKSNFFTIFWYFLFYTLLYGLFNVLTKLYFNIFFRSIYYMLLFIGTFVSFFMLFYDIIAFYKNQDLSGVIIGFKTNVNNAGNFFLFLCDLVLQFIFNVGILLTIYVFSPFHFITSEFISELLKYYISTIEFYHFDKKGNYDFIYSTVNIIVFSIVFFINLICSLIFNEIIILKFFGLEYYTKKFINKRGRLESLEIFNDNETINTNENSINND